MNVQMVLPGIEPPRCPFHDVPLDADGICPTDYRWR